MKNFALFLTLFAMPVHAGATYPSGKPVECYCTDRKGARIELGETICMNLGGRLYMAQCQMSLNVPMWREVQKGCLNSSLRTLPDAGQDPLQSLLVHTHI